MALLKRAQQPGGMADLRDVLPRWKPWQPPKLDQVGGPKLAGFTAVLVGGLGQLCRGEGRCGRDFGCMGPVGGRSGWAVAHASSPWKRMSAQQLHARRACLPRMGGRPAPPTPNATLQALQQGGIFLFDGDRVAFSHFDEATGAHADLAGVVALAQGLVASSEAGAAQCAASGGGAGSS